MKFRECSWRIKSDHMYRSCTIIPLIPGYLESDDDPCLTGRYPEPGKRTTRKAVEAASYIKRAERREEKGELHVTIHRPAKRKTDMQENAGETKAGTPEDGENSKKTKERKRRTQQSRQDTDKCQKGRNNQKAILNPEL